jgi:hypothetical protein
MRTIYYLTLLAMMTTTGCIGDDIIEDFVEPRLRILSPPSQLAVGDTTTLSFTFLDETGQEATVTPSYTTSNSAVATVNDDGQVITLAEGEVDIVVWADYIGQSYADTASIVVTMDSIIIDEPEQRSGIVSTTSSYVLSGNFTITETDGGLTITFAEDYIADRALPGLYVYLTNNTATTRDAHEIGAVRVFDGAHSYVVEGVGIDDFSDILYFCKPFNVKVGDGAITQ